MKVQGGYTAPEGDGITPTPPTTGSGVKAAQPSYIEVKQVDVAKLNIEPGDILMVVADRPITDQQASRIGDGFRHAFEKSGGNVPEILVIDGGLEVKIVRRDLASPTVERPFRAGKPGQSSCVATGEQT